MQVLLTRIRNLIEVIKSSHYFISGFTVTQSQLRLPQHAIEKPQVKLISCETQSRQP